MNLELPFVGDPVADRERSTHRPLGIVLTRNRRAEERNHGIADELLDRPAPALELVAQPLVVGAQDCLDVLRVELLGARREADKVGEEDSDDLPLSTGLSHTRSVKRALALGLVKRYGKIDPANHVPALTQPLPLPPQPWFT
jgi:hypothetical protein